MNIETFTKLLDQYAYAYEVREDGGVSVTDPFSVDLDNLTVLPEGTKFNNGSYVHLDSLTVLPEGTEFNNGSYVHLGNLTVLPEGTQFNNGGNVYLYNLTTLPEGIQFNNGLNVYLYNLTDETQRYRGQTLRLRNIDGYTTLIESEKPISGGSLMRARYFGGGELKDLRPCWVAQIGEYTAHGDDKRQAVADAHFKHLQATIDVHDLAQSVKQSGKITFDQYRLLTGACASGLRHGLAERGHEGATEMDLNLAIEISEGTYNNEQFRELMGLAR